MKKGFTLVELLAVIIILAVVALIATPIVLDVVDDARISAAKSEAAMIVSGVDNYCAAAEMREQLTGETNICKDGVTKEEVATMVDLGNAKILEIVYNNISTNEVAILAYSGNARVASANQSGRVTYLKVESNNKTVLYDGHTYTIEGEVESKNNVYNASDIIYLDPTDLNKVCNSSNSTIETGQKTGCMKWYVITTDDTSSKTSVNIILAHNTTDKIAYNSNNNSADSSEIDAKIIEDTTGWDSSLKPRLISVDEIKSITGNKTFTTENLSNSNFFYYFSNNTNVFPTEYISVGTNKYAWLFDNTTVCTLYGCNEVDNSTGGYWTSSIVPTTENITNFENNLWGVSHQGNISVSQASHAATFGIRPVVTIDKKYIKNSEKYVQSNQETGSYNYYNIGTKAKLKDGSTWYVVESSSSANPNVKLMSEYNVKNNDNIGDSIGNDMFTTESEQFAIAYDTNGSATWETSSLKIYLNSVVKEKLENGLETNISEIKILGAAEMEILGLYRDNQIRLGYRTMNSFVKGITTWLTIPASDNIDEKYVYTIKYLGGASTLEVTDTQTAGARPIITVSKDVIVNN